MKIKTYITIALFFVVIGELTGCAMLHPNRGLEQACVNSPALYTDLTKSMPNRHYALPSGQACSVFDEGKSHA